jgi:hypothetical protein
MSTSQQEQELRTELKQSREYSRELMRTLKITQWKVLHEICMELKELPPKEFKRAVFKRAENLYPINWFNHST